MGASTPVPSLALLGKSCRFLPQPRRFVLNERPASGQLAEDAVNDLDHLFHIGDLDLFVC